MKIFRCPHAGPPKFYAYAMLFPSGTITEMYFACGADCMENELEIPVEAWMRYDSGIPI